MRLVLLLKSWSPTSRASAAARRRLLPDKTTDKRRGVNNASVPSPEAAKRPGVKTKAVLKTGVNLDPTSDFENPRAHLQLAKVAEREMLLHKKQALNLFVAGNREGFRSSYESWKTHRDAHAVHMENHIKAKERLAARRSAGRKA